ISSKSSEARPSLGSTSTPGIRDDCSTVLMPSPPLLHQVEHIAERFSEFQRFLDFVGRDIWIFAILEKAMALMFPEKFVNSWRICFPVFRESFKVFKNSVNPRFLENRYRVLYVLVKICIENALIHEMQSRADVEHYPAQVVQL